MKMFFCIVKKQYLAKWFKGMEKRRIIVMRHLQSIAT